MKSLQNKVLPCISVGITLVMGSLSIGLNIRTSRMRASVATPHGCYTVQQFIGQTGRLDALLTPVAEEYTYTAEYMETYRLGRPVGGYWAIVCTNKSGTRERNFHWNAYSGQLEAVSCIDPQEPNSGNVLSSRAALGCAIEWGQTLGWIEPHEQWELTEPPCKLPREWSLDIKAGQKRLLIRINDRNGRMLAAQVNVGTNNPQNR